MRLRNLSVATALTLGLALSASSQYVTDGLVSYWSMDADTINGSTVGDSTGANDATIMGALTSTDGMIGEALQFDGGENYVEIPALGMWPAVSVDLWTMEDEFAGIQGILSTWQWEPGKVHFKYEANQIQLDKNGAGKLAVDAEAGVWYHVAYTMDTATGVRILYVNGVNVGEGDAGAEPENLDERRLGSEHDGRYLIGKIDEVRLYDRALSADEVMQNYMFDGTTTAVDPQGKAATSWGAIKSR